MKQRQYIKWIEPTELDKHALLPLDEALALQRMGDDFSQASGVTHKDGIPKLPPVGSGHSNCMWQCAMDFDGFGGKDGCSGCAVKAALMIKYCGKDPRKEREAEIAMERDVG